MKYRPSSLTARASRDSIAVNAQTYRYWEFLKQRGPGPVYVFPCKRTGNARQTREILASLLSGDPEPYDSYSLNRAEAKCAGYGYPFVEIDPTDYPAR